MGSKAMYRAKFAHDDNAPISLSSLERLRTLRAFDHYVTSPLHGFDGVDDYYERCSCRQRLGEIRCPTLILQARDDPIVPAATIVDPATLPGDVELEVSPRGGHVGFVEGAPWQPRYWLETRILNALGGML